MKWMQSCRRLLGWGLGLGMVLGGLTAAGGQTTVVAWDSATNSVYSGGNWSDGQNGGTGFAAWEIAIAGGNYRGSYSGNPEQKGVGGMNSPAWGLYCHSFGNSVTARRPFSQDMVVGDTLSFQWGFNLGSGGTGSKGFTIYAGATPLVTATNGAGTEVYVNGVDSGFGDGTNAMTWVFEYVNATTLVVTANGRDGVSSYSNDVAIASAPDALTFFMTRQGDDTQAREPFYNDLLIQHTDNREAPEILSWPAASPLAWGDRLADAGLTGGVAGIDGVFEWVNEEVIPGAGTTLQEVRFVPADTDTYSVVVSQVLVTAVGGIYINEVQSSNGLTIEDEDGDTPDWIELYNATDAAIPLAGWGLSDSAKKPFKWVFGEVSIQPHEYLIVFASDKDRRAITNGNYLHTSFGISSDGEDIVLTDSHTNRMDLVPAKVISRDYSLGRYPNGTGDLWFFQAPTPGAANHNNGYLTDLPPVAFSVPGGYYTSTVSLELSTTEEDATIRYTLDGSEPTASSPAYSNALSIGVRSTPNDLSAIQTTYGTGGEDDWEAPDGSVFKFYTVRARIFKDGSPGPHTTHSYIVTPAGTNRYTLPVVSIATDKANLFDNTIGIYTPVNNNMMQKGAAWERTGTIEYFEPDGTLAFSGNVGLRLHGNTTRSRPRKAIRVYARGPGKFKYKLFDDLNLATFETFILRNGGNDWGQGLLRDLYAQSLTANPTLDRQHGRPVIVFLDGEYWGIHDLRERFDEGYIDNHYGLGELEYVQVEIDRDVGGNPNVPVYDSGNRAWGADYSNLWAYVKNHNLTVATNYAVVQDWMDLDNFADFFQAHIFVGNSDWPGNNIRAWRSIAQVRDEGAPHGLDGRWRYMIYDMDFAFGLDYSYVPGNKNFDIYKKNFGLVDQFNMLAYVQNAEQDGATWANEPDATVMYRKLMANPEFRQHFMLRFSDQLNTSYSRAWATSQWARVSATIQPELAEHVARWRQPTNWAQHGERIEYFAQQRPAAVWTHLQDVLKLDWRVPVTVEANDEQGLVRINTIELSDQTPGFAGYPWTGTYFTNYPVTLTAVAKPGYEFVEWRAALAADVVIAADSANNYTRWNNGNNRGYGFGAWTLSKSGNSGYFLDQGGQWGLWANNGGRAEIERPLSTALGVGQTIGFRMQNRWVTSGGSVGVSLRNAADQTLWSITFTNGHNFYNIAGQTNVLAYTTAPIDVELTLTAANTYTARITAGGAEPVILSGNLAGSGSIEKIYAVNHNAGDTSNCDFFVNDLRVFARGTVGAKTSYSTNETIAVTLTGASQLEAVFEEVAAPDYKLIHYWNFNDSGALLAPTFTKVAGAGMAFDLPEGSEAVAGTGQDFFAENARFGDEASSHLRVNNPLGVVMDVAMPTRGYEDIVVKFEVRRSGKGAGTLNLYYTLDGEDYEPLQTVTTYDAAPNLITLDFSAMTSVDNNTNFALRIEFEQGGGGNAGNVRFDNWTVEGLALEGFNLPPEIVAPVGHQSLMEGGGSIQVDLNDVFQDPDYDALAFEASSSRSNLVALNLAGSMLTVIPQARGGATVTVTADDGENEPVSSTFYVLVNPTAHVLANAAYTFGEWETNEPAFSYPTNMLFLQSAKNDPGLNDELLYAYMIPAADAALPEDAEYPYAASSRTRINGLGTNGIAFINTGRGRDVGGALVALDTRGVAEAPVTWLGGTVLPNKRIYAIRLQYRVGATGAFTDVLDDNGQPVEYLRSETVDHSATLGPVSLPAAALEQEYMQVLWRYYYQTEGSGARAQLRLDDLMIANGPPPLPTGFAAWQGAEFSPEELANPAISGPLADPTDSGLANLMRYALGLTRNADFHQALPFATVTGETPDTAAVFRHRRLLTPNSGVEYIPEYAEGLITAQWHTAITNSDLIWQGATPTGDGLTEEVEYLVPAGSLQPLRFFRLKVRLME